MPQAVVNSAAGAVVSDVRTTIGADVEICITIALSWVAAGAVYGQPPTGIGTPNHCLPTATAVRGIALHPRRDRERRLASDDIFRIETSVGKNARSVRGQRSAGRQASRRNTVFRRTRTAAGHGAGRIFTVKPKAAVVGQYGPGAQGRHNVRRRVHSVI